jgi:hypothetical protein
MVPPLDGSRSDSVAAWVSAKCDVVKASQDTFVRPGVAGAWFLRAEQEDGRRGLYIEFNRCSRMGSAERRDEGGGETHVCR